MEKLLFFAGSFFIEGGLVLILMRLLTRRSDVRTEHRGAAAGVPKRKAA